MYFEAISEDNYPVVSQIYQNGLDTGIASFETKAKPWNEWNDHYLPFGRLVMRDDHGIYAWAALSPVSTREVYCGVAEVSIYMHADARGKGLGRQLFNQLIEVSEANGIWTLQSSIFPQNKRSIALHRSCGFREIGYRERIAVRDGIWYDNVLFERRSPVVHP